MKKLILVLCTAIFLTACSKSPEKMFLEQLELGQKYLEELNYEAAIVAYKKAIELEPKAERAYLDLSWALAQREEYEEAIEILQEGLEKMPGNENILQVLERLVPSVSCSAKEGAYNEPLFVELESKGKNEIYYSIDSGSEKTKNILYQEPIELSESGEFCLTYYAVSEYGTRGDVEKREIIIDIPTETGAYLGAANVANGGIATGNSRYTYYVTHPSKYDQSICREDNNTGKVEVLYTDQIIKSLNLMEDDLFFCAYSDDFNRIMKISGNQSEAEVIYVTQDMIDHLTAYQDKLYFNAGKHIVSCNVDGSNEQVLFRADEYGIPFCIVKDRIYYSNPEVFAQGGFYYGKLLSMDLEGNSNREILTEVVVCNEYIFSDGTWLYFSGSEFFRCKLDGSNLTSMNQYAGHTYNIQNGQIYKASNFDGIDIYDGNDWAFAFQGKYDNIHIVGDWIYYTETNYVEYDSGVVTKRIKLDGSSDTMLD